MHKAEEGAVIQNVAGLHIPISQVGGLPSVSTQIAALRHLLLEAPKGISAHWFQGVIEASSYSPQCQLI
jgi:hypothetical protein